MTDFLTPAPLHLSRRRLLGAGASAALITALPLPAGAAPKDLMAARQEIFGQTPVETGRVALTLPAIAENGYSVSLAVDVDSPMTQADHVRRIVILSPRNPVARVATFHLSPASGKARVQTRVRLGGTQSVEAIAEMSDGRLFSGAAKTVVTLAACVVL